MWQFYEADDANNKIQNQIKCWTTKGTLKTRKGQSHSSGTFQQELILRRLGAAENVWNKATGSNRRPKVKGTAIPVTGRGGP
jgi:hypothetical protein